MIVKFHMIVKFPYPVNHLEISYVKMYINKRESYPTCSKLSHWNINIRETPQKFYSFIILDLFSMLSKTMYSSQAPKHSGFNNWITHKTGISTSQKWKANILNILHYCFLHQFHLFIEQPTAWQGISISCL